MNSMTSSDTIKKKKIKKKIGFGHLEATVAHLVFTYLIIYCAPKLWVGIPPGGY